LVAAVLTAAPLDPGDYTRTLTVDGRERSYLVHVPDKAAGRPAPVVLIFHGGALNAKQMVNFCGLNQKADEAGFIAVYPNGSGPRPSILTFNGGNCCGYAQRLEIDDVTFTRRLLDDLESAASIDTKRIYATGFSNGAMMTYRIANELSDRIAAIAPVSGPVGSETCNPSRPVPVLHFHGTKDEFCPIEGKAGPRSTSRTDFFSVDQSVKTWVKANGCDPEPKIEALPDTTDDGTRATRTTYSGGREGSEVILITIEGAGHTWPGREAALKLLGPSSKAVDANDLMWDFFQKHSR
jgi:polyhydroxybutyrate depolymerase